MENSLSTCWTMIRGAADGIAGDREAFARRYLPVIRAYLGARWRRSRFLQELDDAVQQVFVECYRDQGVLQKANPDRSGGFRAFLYGVLRNVALRVEAQRARRDERQLEASADLPPPDTSEEHLSQIFDRAWAQSIMQEAGLRQTARAEDHGEDALRRVELLRLRFQESLPIREIAVRWGVEASWVHHEYAKARAEFKTALLEILAFHEPESGADLEAECARLLALLAE